MKVLVVLVFAVFTGYNANLVSADASTPNLEELYGTLQGYAQTARKTADDTLQRIMESETGQTVSTRLLEGLKDANTYTKNAWDSAPDWAKSAKDSAVMGVYGLSLQIEESLDAARRTLEPLEEKLAPVKERVQSELTQRAEEVLEFAAPYTDKLKETLNPVAKQIQARVTQVYSSLVESN